MLADLERQIGLFHDEDRTFPSSSVNLRLDGMFDSNFFADMDNQVQSLQNNHQLRGSSCSSSRVSSSFSCALCSSCMSNSLFSLYAAYRIALEQASTLSLANRVFMPWACIIALLFALGIWLVLQPMQMRGTFPMSG